MNIIFKKLFTIFTCFLLSIYAGSDSGKVFTYQQALAKCDELNLKPQKPEADGRTQTLNKKGAATAKLDYAIRQFLKFSKGKTVLEIGGAYGDVMLQALRHSKETSYTLNDLD